MRAASQRCGKLNDVDGSEDNLIKVQNQTDYDMYEGIDNVVVDSDATDTAAETDDDSSLYSAYTDSDSGGE